jgi:DNA polymerase-3 subunit beta
MHGMNIACGKSKYRIPTLEPADFPEFPHVELERTVELPSSRLAQMVSKVYRVTSKDNSRAILQGVQLTVENNTIRLVATDSYRLAVCDTNVATMIDEPFTAIVPGNTFHDVLALPSMADEITVGTTDSQVVFSFGNTTFISRRIEGNFPNYRQLISGNSNTKVTINVQDFAAALKRVSVLATTSPSVRFDVSAADNTMRMTASSPDQGESSEVIDVEVEGDDVVIALNHRFVSDCMSAVDAGSDLMLELEGSMRPGIFRSFSEINYLYLLMPVRL